MTESELREHVERRTYLYPVTYTYPLKFRLQEAIARMVAWDWTVNGQRTPTFARAWMEVYGEEPDRVSYRPTTYEPPAAPIRRRK